MSLIKAITNNTNLTIGAIKTFLTVNTASGATTLTVKNLTSFVDNQIIVIGEFANEGAEIATINGTPSSATITLDSATTFPHSASSPVIVIDFDQVEFSHTTTTTGSKTVLSTVNMVVDTPDFTRYNDTTYTTGYYFIRFKNSITSLFSDYSDPIPVAGYGLWTARSIIDDALSQINKTTSETLSDSFAFQQIDNCQTEALSEYKRWSFMQKFDTIIGTVSTGSWKVAIPDDLDDENTNKSIYTIRIGTQQRLTWVDKEKFDEFQVGVAYTTLASTLSVGASTMTLTDSSDFEDSGTVTIGAYDYAYTANNTSTGVLTLTSVVPASENQASGADVFQGATQGLPRYWTIYGGYIYHTPNTASSYDGKNIYMDYYIKQEKITTDSVEIVLPDPALVSYYLQWKFLKKLANGEETQGSMAAKENFVSNLAKMKQKEVSGRTFKLRPRLQNFAIQSAFNDGDNRAVRTGNFQNTGF
jgi:hypothetical protein